MKNTRILIALALILVVVAVTRSAGAWNSKLQTGNESLASSRTEAGIRLNGTADGNSEKEVPPVADDSATGDCAYLATYCVGSDQTGLVVEAITELPAGITLPEGANVVITRVIQISSESNTLEKAVILTLDPPLKDGEKVAYWNGTEWVELIADANGKYTIPAGTALPVTVAVFTS
jgi:hypothetical protein